MKQLQVAASVSNLRGSVSVPMPEEPVVPSPTLKLKLKSQLLRQTSMHILTQI